MTTTPTPEADDRHQKLLPPGGRDGPAGPLLRLVRDRRVAFLIVGSINTIVGLAWFAVFDATIGPRWGYMATLGTAHVAAVLCAFALYRRFVFRVRGHVLLDLARFEVVNLTSLAFNAVTLPLLVELAHLQPLPAQVVITFATMIISYFGHRDFSFRRRRRTAGRQA